MTKLKLSLCPYCGELLSAKPKSTDHIIPRQIGGNNSFTILCCQKCNSEISKIEQTAIGSIGFRNMMAEIGESGVNVKTRRKRDYTALQKAVGLSFLSAHTVTPTMRYYNNESRKKEIVFLTPPKEPLIAGKTYKMVIPSFATEDDEKERISQVALVNKIVLGTCAWLWGDNFTKTEQAKDLRRKMNGSKISEILEMERDEKHLELPNSSGNDALDNKPHHSVLVGVMDNKGMENTLVGLVNLFGDFESMTFFGECNDKFRDWLGNNGVVVISKTTQNQVLKISWEEYCKLKQTRRKI